MGTANIRRVEVRTMLVEKSDELGACAASWEHVCVRASLFVCVRVRACVYACARVCCWDGLYPNRRHSVIFFAFRWNVGITSRCCSIDITTRFCQHPDNRHHGVLISAFHYSFATYWSGRDSEV